MKRIITALLFLPIYIFAQELDATVTINFENLPAKNKDFLIDFAQTMQSYINSNRYTSDNWEGDKIKCAFNIFFDSAPDETHYTAQVSVTSLRPIFKSTRSSLMLNVLDNNWSFIYQKGQSVYFNQSNFDPLTSFFDYYAYIILGLDADSFNQLGGSPYFTQAFNIVMLGTNSTNSKGWEKNSNAYNRRGLVEEITSEQYRIFREDYFYYHYNGLDIFQVKPGEAETAIVRLITNLDALRIRQDIRGVMMKTFFDAKSNEIISYLSSYNDKNIFSLLKKIDPSHISKYDEAINK
ncbi:MAG: DUF4835 family protein [Ignavibacteria bacterium]